MSNRVLQRVVCALAAIFVPVIAASSPTPVERVNFDRDVLPILAENCFPCHGFDAAKRQGGLRLDIPGALYNRLASGHIPVVPRDLQKSELVRRVEGPEASRMPPSWSGKHLSADQIRVLHDWVAQGGAYVQHWAWVAPRKPAVPPVRDARWCRNDVDRFVLNRLEAEGLRPSREADRPTLIRRVAFDVTGLPPTPAEIDRFVGDRRPGAYERMVDRYLSSPRYGERMANQWLDLARYADTHGYHIDSAREMWRWRDWVIGAYNRNMPYDTFVKWQLAGDLLPHATFEQRIASGFNRNHPIDFEGGAIPEEYQANYNFDRVDTTATVFMGLTMHCAQCHDHKYDPITNRDFYRFYAFFNNIAEEGLDGQKGNAVPYIKAPTAAQARETIALATHAAAAQRALDRCSAAGEPKFQEWLKDTAPRIASAVPAAGGLAGHWTLDNLADGKIVDAVSGAAASVNGRLEPATGQIGGGARFDGMSSVEVGKALAFDRTSKFSYGAWIHPESMDAMTVISRMNDAEGFRGWDLYLDSGRLYVHLIHSWESNAIRVVSKDALSLNAWHHVFVVYDGSGKAAGVTVYVDGKAVELDRDHDSLTGTIVSDVPVRIGRRHDAAPFKGIIDEVRVYSRSLTASEVGAIYDHDTVAPLLASGAAPLRPEQERSARAYFLHNFDPDYARDELALGAIKGRQAALDAMIPTSMVMQERAKHRDTFMLIRGQYDHPGAMVTPGTPEFLPPMPPGARRDRLGMAEWLMSPAHPLTSRVAVNRYWQLLFGDGLVRTPENFGIQGDYPTHMHLLDWLAVRFRESHWNVKGMLRLLLTSATFRQQSTVTPQLLQRDPDNKLLTRGPRFRLSAEMLRDQALAASGLLVEHLGGPSVKPYQPKGLWKEISFGAGFSAQEFVQDHGDKLYRRSMYTFWKRTSPPPTMQVFDAPNRDVCVVRRPPTDTPLQALALMNDPQFVEAARKLAERMMLQGGWSAGDRIAYGFRLLTGRTPDLARTRILEQFYTRELARFQQHPADAQGLLSVGEKPRNGNLNIARLAAWTLVADAMLNLDEAITLG